MNNIFLIFLIIIILILIIVSVVFYINANNKLKQCRNTENILCPTYYCPNTPDGTPTSKCFSTGATSVSNPTGSKKSAFRVDKDGNLQCQRQTIDNSQVITPAYDNLKQICQFDNICFLKKMK